MKIRINCSAVILLILITAGRTKPFATPFKSYGLGGAFLILIIVQLLHYYPPIFNLDEDWQR
jgi:hypothetical protein